MPDFDTVIAGAGPAGCAAAFDLAQAGKRVLLLDRRTFPRPKACACGLTPKTLKALRYSVEPVLERRCRDVSLQEAGPAFAHGRRSADKGLEVRFRTLRPFCAMAVRERFDEFCLNQTLAAARQGGHIEFRRMEGILALREHPTHLELDLQLPGGSLQTLVTPVLLGADGSNGQTRRLAARLADARNANATLPQAAAATLGSDPAWYQRGFALEAILPYADLPAALPAGDRPHDFIVDFAPLAGGYGWLFPKGDHINIGVGAFVPASPEDDQPFSEPVTRAALARYIHEKLGVHAPAAVTGQYLGLGGDAYLPEGRLLLTGDAAGLVDPLTGEGIHSAISSGQAAAAAILSDNPDLAAAYARHLQPLQETLRFSRRAARSFYREPSRGFRVMRTPLLRRLVLKTYADGLPITALRLALAAKRS